jgi:hypothetical protein
LLMMSSCPGTFAVAKNPNNALIWPVQFCRATSYHPTIINLILYLKIGLFINERQPSTGQATDYN